MDDKIKEKSKLPRWEVLVLFVILILLALLVLGKFSDGSLWIIASVNSAKGTYL